MFKKWLIASVILCANPAISSIFDANKALIEEDYQSAKVLLEELAKVGNAEAQYKLAILHYQGKAGIADKPSAFAWFALAKEYQYADSAARAQEVLKNLSEEEQVAALERVKNLKQSYSAANLFSGIYPEITDQPDAKRAFSEPAKELQRFELRTDDPRYRDKRAEARNRSVEQTAITIDRANRGYRHNAYDNFDKIKVKDESGLVIIKHDVDASGKMTKPMVVFSWPIGRFEEPTIYSLEKSTYAAAVHNGKAVSQSGVVSFRRIGAIGPNDYKSVYPHEYDAFIEYRKRAKVDNQSKYIYANLLRAYDAIIAAEQPKSYDVLLAELAKDGFVDAQYDYAMHLIYQKGDLDMGLSWLVEAAKKGFAKAEYALGDLLYNPPSAYVVQDKTKAKFWLDRAAKQGLDYPYY